MSSFVKTYKLEIREFETEILLYYELVYSTLTDVYTLANTKSNLLSKHGYTIGSCDISMVHNERM